MPLSLTRLRCADRFRLRASCALSAALALLTGCSGGGGGDEGGGSQPPPTVSITVSGVVSFDRVRPAVDPDDGLDFGNVLRAPAREVIVEALAADRRVLASGLTDRDGRYALVVPAGTQLSIRARAQSRWTGTASRPGTWNLRVRDNTDANAAYAIESPLASTGTVAESRDLHAASGWTGTRYGTPRAAAPFAVLDTLYSAVLLVSDADPSRNLPDLEIYWSPRNRASAEFRPELGEIVTTSYRSILGGASQGGIYVQGLEDVDTDEFDAHVIAHEYFHYVEDIASRSDATGGDHSLLEKLDARLAFSEGFANAFAAMVVGDPVYRDSFAARQAESFHFDVEDNAWQSLQRVEGWYNEASVQAVVYDAYDLQPDGTDAMALGFGPLYTVLRDELRDGAALTTLFAFVDGLERQPGVPLASLRALLAEQDVGRGVANPDAWAGGEGNSGGNPDALPLYLSLVPNGAPVVACTNAEEGGDNKLGNRRLLRFELPQAGRVEILAISADGGSPAPDPDLVLYRGGRIASSETIAPGGERYVADLVAGTYVLEVYEWTHVDPGATLAERRPRTCMNVTITG